MISSSQSGHNQVTEETPSWEAISYALKLLFSEFNVDLSRVAASQRLSYEDFEVIFYHLFVIIDPQETKRRFRNAFKVRRGQEEKARFMESAVRFINDKQLFPQKISTSQLRMLGGEPFRRLTCSLIKTASERELDRKELSIEDQIESQHWNNKLDVKLGLLDEKVERISSSMQELNQSMQQLRDIRKSLEDSNETIADKWAFLERRLDGGHNVSPAGNRPLPEAGSGGGSNSNSKNQRDVSIVVRALLERFGVSHKTTKTSIEKINSMELPPEETLSGSFDEPVARKRLSQFIREAVSKFDSGLDLLPEAQQTRENERKRQQLVDYDCGVEKLVELWREEENRLGEELLQSPNMRELFSKLEELIPMIQLTPIGSKVSTDPVPVKLSDIEDILKDYPDSRYDDQEILAVTKRHLGS